MCSRCPERLSAWVILVLLTASCTKTPEKRTEPARVLRVCSDPNNLPFSDERQEGFENRIANLLAGEMGATLQYTWWAQRRGYLRNTLNASKCDVYIGVPDGMERVITTRPYYRSTYVFVYRKDRGITVRGFDDPILKSVRVGVQLIGDDAANTPPAHALSRRGITANVRGYPVYGDYAKDSPVLGIMDAVASGAVDVAVVWGPIAGYYRKTHSTPLEIVPVSPQIELPYLPFVFDISVAVRRGDEALRDELDQALEHKAAEIRSILSDYGVPVIAPEEGGGGS